ncbi:phosphotransferase family protein [Phaeacidiphilus oryzae]|uniref:phosphotransferase family protein n=1 Tax=Phaeacidiphilus oryzae TaxID=348818 RepID=UPI0007C8544F|nr:phosphotransferase family protein [Phaeacidiphilus oryzae]
MITVPLDPSGPSDPSDTRSQDVPDDDSEALRLRRSSRDAAQVPGRLAEFLAQVLPAGAEPEVAVEAGIDQNGMSSDTLICKVTWRECGAARTRRFVARVAPAEHDVPVFPNYRLDHQYAVMSAVAELTSVPVPPVRWMEPTGEVLGAPFFLMEHVEGRVPPDVLPYTLGSNWLFDGPPEAQRRLQEETVSVLAEVHGIPDAAERFAFLDEGRRGDTALRRHLDWCRRWYEYGAAGIGRSALVERAFTWLEANWPTEADRRDPVLLWGDARIGNVLYEDFRPVGVLDWEMTAVGPRELDLSWLVFAHRVFQHMAESAGLPGIAHLLREEDVLDAYARRTGIRVGADDLRWFHVYSAVMWCCVFLRTGARQLHFGEIARPPETEALFYHRALLERLLDDAGDGGGAEAAGTGDAAGTAEAAGDAAYGGATA